MTLVIALYKDDAVVMFADSAVSWHQEPGSARRDVALPSMPNDSGLDDCPRGYSHPAQKLVQVGQNQFMGLSGKANDAISLARHVRAHLAQYTGANIEDAVFAYEGPKEDVGCIGVGIGSSGALEIAGNIHVDYLSHGVRALVIGSGRDQFLEWANSEEKINPAGLSTHYYLVGIGSRFLGQAVATQHKHGVGLNEGWGGSFEVLLRTGPQSLEKADNCFAVSFELVVTDTNRVRPKQIGPQLFWTYRERILYLASTFPSPDPAVEPHLKTTCYQIDELDPQPTRLPAHFGGRPNWLSIILVDRRGRCIGSLFSWAPTDLLVEYGMDEGGRIWTNIDNSSLNRHVVEGARRVPLKELM